MRPYFLFFALILTLQNCTEPNNKLNAENTNSLLVHSTSGSDSALLEEYISFYGFIVKNNDQHDFYCIDSKVMTKYISNKQIDSTVIKQDILMSQWFSPIIGTSYDYFVWLNFIENKHRFVNMEFQVCNHDKKSQIVPVYVTQFNRKLNDLQIKMDDCNDFYPSGIYKKASLNLVYVIPLNYEAANNYLNLRDTLSREKYKTFVENIIH